MRWGARQAPDIECVLHPSPTLSHDTAVGGQRRTGCHSLAWLLGFPLKHDGPQALTLSLL